MTKNNQNEYVWVSLIKKEGVPKSSKIMGLSPNGVRRILKANVLPSSEHGNNHKYIEKLAAYHGMTRKELLLDYALKAP